MFFKNSLYSSQIAVMDEFSHSFSKSFEYQIFGNHSIVRPFVRFGRRKDGRTDIRTAITNLIVTLNMCKAPYIFQFDMYFSQDTYLLLFESTEQNLKMQ